MVAKVKSEKLAISTEKIENYFDNYWKLIEIAFSNERRTDIKDKFDQFASRPAILAIDGIRAATDASKDDKIAALTRVYEAAVLALDEIQKPELSKVFWKDRADRFADPFQFIKDNYPSYGNGLTQLDVKHHDKQLYKRIHNEKEWPADFVLPKISDGSDAVVEQFGREPTLREIINLSPPLIQSMLRAYMSSARRGQKSSKP